MWVQKSGICICICIYVCKPSTCSCKNGKHLESIISDSVFVCDEILKATKAVPTKESPNQHYFNKNCSNNFYEKGNL